MANLFHIGFINYTVSAKSFLVKFAGDRVIGVKMHSMTISISGDIPMDSNVYILRIQMISKG